MSDESYFNTTHVRGQELRLYELAAKRQDERVLEFFNANPRAELTAEDIGRLVLPRTPRTSWGRTLTNLTTRNLLEKTDKQVEGAWGRPIYTWRLRPVPPTQSELFS